MNYVWLLSRKFSVDIGMENSPGVIHLIELELVGTFFKSCSVLNKVRSHHHYLDSDPEESERYLSTGFSENLKVTVLSIVTIR